MIKSKRGKEKVAKLKNDKAKAFIKEASSCSEKKYESVGNGWDYRYEGKLVIGSALLYRKKVIHMAFLRLLKARNPDLWLVMGGEGDLGLIRGCRHR